MNERKKRRKKREGAVKGWEEGNLGLPKKKIWLRPLPLVPGYIARLLGEGVKTPPTQMPVTNGDVDWR